MKRNRYRLLAVLLLSLATAIYLGHLHKEKMPERYPRDYFSIKAEGILNVATEYNSISFFVDGDTVSGFHYELIEAFASSQGLKTNVVPVMSFEDRLSGLANGTYDVIASDLLATNEWKDSLLLTSPIILNKQVLVQRKGDENDSLFVKSQLDLAGRTLHVTKGSPSILRIENLSNEIGDAINVKEVERYGSEQLIAMVAHGDIDYAVCDEGIAKAALDSLPGLDISTDISFTQFYSWAVSKQSPVLLDSLNSWLNDFSKGRQYRRIYRKYYKKR